MLSRIWNRQTVTVDLVIAGLSAGLELCNTAYGKTFTSIYDQVKRKFNVLIYFMLQISY